MKRPGSVGFSVAGRKGFSPPCRSFLQPAQEADLNRKDRRLKIPDGNGSALIFGLVDPGYKLKISLTESLNLCALSGSIAVETLT